MLMILLAICAVLLGWALSNARSHLAILLGIAVLAVAVILYLRMTRINKEILYFFRALENEDSSLKYKADHRNSLIDELHRNLNRVNENFQSLRLRLSGSAKTWVISVSTIDSSLIDRSVSSPLSRAMMSVI